VLRNPSSIKLWYDTITSLTLHFGVRRLNAVVRILQRLLVPQLSEELVAMETARERATERTSVLKTHRTWEDWAGIALSISIILSPWMARQSTDTGVVMITVLLGLMLLTLAQYELVKAHRSVEVVELACGVAVLALPMLLGYAGALRTWHFALGGLVSLLALLELWQGWSNGPARATDRTQPVANPNAPFHGDIH
jgi:hypothetical protein